MKKLFSILIAICLIAGLLPVVASAASAANISFGFDGGSTPANVEEGQVAYFLTKDGRAHNNGNAANEGNYNIKVDFTGSEPVIYLKGAELSAPKSTIYLTGSAEVPSYSIVVEEDSTIASTNGDCITAKNAHLTISGEGKLNIDVMYGIGIHMNETTLSSADPKPLYDLTFDNANVELTIDGTQGNFVLGAGNHARAIIFDGGTFVGNSDKAAMFYLYKGEFLITNNAKLELNINNQSGFSRGKSADFVMESGTIISKTTSALFGFSQDSTITFKGGTVEHAGGPFIYGPVPDFSEYLDEHTITVCNSADGKGAEIYDPEKHNLSYQNFFQLTSGASYEVTVKNGTVDKAVANKGDTITITARIAPEGKAFDKWEVNEGNITLADPTAATTTFTMPGENVKVTATYKDVDDEGNDEPVDDPVDTPNTDDTPDNTPDNTPETETTPDTDNTGKDEGNKKPAKKANVTNVLLIVIIAILVLAIGAGVVFIVIRVKKLDASEDAEATEEAE